MSEFTSTIQILKVDAPVEKTSPKDQSKYMVHTAQCMLLNDDGSLDVVARLRIPQKMIELVKVGIFRAAFALERAEWGPNKGDVIASLVGLVPVAAKPAPIPAKGL
jgi:hypothetical protein